MAVQATATALLSSDPERAWALIDEGAAVGQLVDNPMVVHTTAQWQLLRHLQQRDWRAALEQVSAGLESATKTRDWMLANNVLFFGFVALASAGDLQSAALLVGAIRGDSAFMMNPYMREHFERAIELCRERLGEDRFTALMTRGAAMDQDNAMLAMKAAYERLVANDADASADVHPLVTPTS
jgi:hypothetical protein